LGKKSERASFLLIAQYIGKKEKIVCSSLTFLGNRSIIALYNLFGK